jgi:hypothetical protein
MGIPAAIIPSTRRVGQRLEGSTIAFPRSMIVETMKISGTMG